MEGRPSLRGENPFGTMTLYTDDVTLEKIGEAATREELLALFQCLKDEKVHYGGLVIHATMGKAIVGNMHIFGQLGETAYFSEFGACRRLMRLLLPFFSDARDDNDINNLLALRKRGNRRKE